jgi:hypothetical protein
MRTATVRRWVACVYAALMLGSASMLVTGSAHAATRPYYEIGNTDCSVIEFTGYGVGLATYFPRVYAVNATRRRDKQVVHVRTDAQQWINGSWVTFAKGDVFEGLAADNNYVVSFRNTRTNDIMLVNERVQFILYINGFYRVVQGIYWYKNGKVPRYGPKYHVTFHSPAPVEAKNQFCLVQ